jgi:hypothetical protein
MTPAAKEVPPGTRRWVRRAALCALSVVGMTMFSAQAVIAQASSGAASRAEQASAANIAEVLGPGHATSGIVVWGGNDWLATAVESYSAAESSEDYEPVPVSIEVFRWDGGAWAVEGAISVADLGSGPSGDLVVRAASVLGLAGPNFEVADGPFGSTSVAIVAAVDGAWRAVPFATSDGKTTIIYGGLVSGGLVEVDNQCYPCTAKEPPAFWYRFLNGAFRITAEPGPPPPCTLGALHDSSVSGLPAASAVTYAKVACEDGLALATGEQAGHQVALLFQRLGTVWAQLAVTDQIPSVVTTDSLDVSVLVHLSAVVGGAASAPVAAAAISPQATTATSHGEQGFPWVTSPMAAGDGSLWVATAGPTGHGTGNTPSNVATVYRWTGSRWDLAGTVPTDLIAGMGPGSIEPAFLTGSPEPDFIFTGSGADYEPTSVVSDVGGRWHAVLFEYGTGLTTVVDGGGAQGRLFETVLDGCGCAAGPESSLWETYRDGVFLPVNPPGPVPACTTSSLGQPFTTFGGPLGASPPLQFSHVACADGWAMAEGTGNGYAGPVVALFEEQSHQWQELQINDGTDLAYEEGEYDIPADLFRSLGAELGAIVAPDIQAAAPPSWLGLPTDTTLSGVMTVNGGYWMVGLIQSQPATPQVSIAVLHWADSRWALQGEVGPIRDYSSLLGLDQWYSALPATGLGPPQLRVVGTYPTWSAVVGYVNGAWRVTETSGH